MNSSEPFKTGEAIPTGSLSIQKQADFLVTFIQSQRDDAIMRTEAQRDELIKHMTDLRRKYKCALEENGRLRREAENMRGKLEVETAKTVVDGVHGDGRSFPSSDITISVKPQLTPTTSTSTITDPAEEHSNTAELERLSARAEHCKIYTNGFLESWRLVKGGGSIEAEGKAPYWQIGEGAELAAQSSAQAVRNSELEQDRSTSPGSNTALPLREASTSKRRADEGFDADALSEPQCKKRLMEGVEAKLPQDGSVGGKAPSQPYTPTVHGSQNSVAADTTNKIDSPISLSQFRTNPLDGAADYYPCPPNEDNTARVDDSDGHWLRNPIVRNLLHHFHLHVKCDRTDEMGPRFQRSTLRTMTPAEANALNLSVGAHEVACKFSLGKTGGYKVIPISRLSTALPRHHSEGIVVRDAGRIRAKNPGKKTLSVEANGIDMIGKVFFFNRKDMVSRYDPNSPSVASLRVIHDFGDVPAGSYVRVPIDCVCYFDRVKD